MKRTRHSPLLVGFALSLWLALGVHAADADFKSLFNGRDLSGWAGLTDYWSVRDGAITGQTTAEKPLKANTFLVWQGGDVKNFTLRLSFKLTAENPQNSANSGVQIRSKVLDAATFSVGGYQADIDMAGRYLGMLYEEKGRGIIMQPGQKVRVSALDPAEANPKQKAKVETLATVTPSADIAAAYKKGEWNELVITASGNRVQQFLNNVLTADVTDTDEAKAATSGVLALQLHTGPPMTIQFKDIQLKTLP